MKICLHTRDFSKKQASQIIISISTSFHLWVHLTRIGKLCGPNLYCVNYSMFPCDPPGDTLKAWTSVRSIPGWVNANLVYRMLGSSFLTSPRGLAMHSRSLRCRELLKRASLRVQPCQEGCVHDIPAVRAWFMEIRWQVFGGVFCLFVCFKLYELQIKLNF